jgi:predicted regulator of Ras-like GTPase activity (Roadblock/LC7/MglB family)
MEVVSSGTLSYISVEPTLHEQIVMAQIGDKGVQVMAHDPTYYSLP